MKKLLSLVVVLISCTVFAETTPVMLSLLTPVQWPDKDVDVTGLRLSLLYGECDNFKGLDIGLINRTNGDFSGLAIGGGNIVDGTIHGVQLGLVNWNQNGSVVWGKRSIGAQLGIVNYSDTFCGALDASRLPSAATWMSWSSGTTLNATMMFMCSPSCSNLLTSAR